MLPSRYMAYTALRAGLVFCCNGAAFETRHCRTSRISGDGESLPAPWFNTSPGRNTQHCHWITPTRGRGRNRCQAGPAQARDSPDRRGTVKNRK